jgi:hypothetical protein
MQNSYEEVCWKALLERLKINCEDDIKLDLWHIVCEVIT